MANPVMLVCGWDENDDFFVMWSEGASQQELMDVADLAKEEIRDGYSRSPSGTSEIQ